MAAAAQLQCVQSSPGVILSRRFHAPRLHVRPLLFPPEFFCNILYMCITLDDSSPFGFNIAEALQIKSIVASRGLLQLVNIHPGADEVGLVMLSRAALSLQHASARLALIWRLPQEQAQARAQLRRSGAERVGRFSLHADLEHRLENEPVH